jgi:hypothetical protein
MHITWTMGYASQVYTWFPVKVDKNEDLGIFLPDSFLLEDRFKLIKSQF